MKFVKKRYTKPTKVKRHTRKIHGNTVKIRPYTRRIKRVKYGFNKSTTNKQYRTAMHKLAPYADVDKDGVRNWDDCRPFDRTRQDEPFSPMPENYHLELETVVYVPSTGRSQKFIGQDKFNRRIKNTRDFLRDTLGGYTSIAATGGFTRDDGTPVHEPVAKVVAFATKEDFREKRGEIKRWLLKKKSEWGQDSIGYEFEGDLYYLE